MPVCLNVNENPYAPEPAVVETIAQRVKEIALTLNRYPDREHIALRQAFCDYLKKESGVDLVVDQLWGANGSNEIMLQLFQAFGGPGRIALGCDPTYSMYPEYARDTFTTWKLAHRNEDFSLNVDATIKAIEDVKPAMIVLTSPNNPTGTPLAMDDLKRILEAAKTAETAKADETAEKSAEPETFTVTREQMEKMEGLAKSLADEQDKYLRLAAEYDNYRKRTAKEKESLYADAKIDTIKALLGVYDNLERGLAQYGDEESPHRKGLEMVFNQFKESLKKLGVETMDAAGKPFDPEKHNAVMHVEDENYGENTVVEVLQQGFTLGDKVLRFAIVKVAN